MRTPRHYDEHAYRNELMRDNDSWTPEEEQEERESYEQRLLAIKERAMNQPTFVESLVAIRELYRAS